MAIMLYNTFYPDFFLINCLCYPMVGHEKETKNGRQLKPIIFGFKTFLFGSFH